MDLAFHFYPFTELGCSNSLIAQITLTIQCPLNFLKFASFPARSIKQDRWSLTTSNIKEYIQGCISVLFSYKIGNVFFEACRAGLLISPLFFWGEIPYHHNMVFPACQQLFLFSFRSSCELRWKRLVVVPLFFSGECYINTVKMSFQALFSIFFISAHLVQVLRFVWFLFIIFFFFAISHCRHFLSKDWLRRIFVLIISIPCSGLFPSVLRSAPAVPLRLSLHRS